MWSKTNEHLSSRHIFVSCLAKYWPYHENYNLITPQSDTLSILKWINIKQKCTKQIGASRVNADDSLHAA